MPRVSHDQKAFYKSQIRSLLVQRPFITQVELKLALEAKGMSLDRKYLGQLLNGIHAERTKRANTWTLNTALADFQDAMGEIVKIGMEIGTDPRQPGRDRAAALREVREAYNAVFEKLFDAGVFERKLGTIEATIRNTPLPDDRKAAIRAVFENWGLLPAPKEDDGTDQPAVAP